VTLVVTTTESPTAVSTVVSETILDTALENVVVATATSPVVVGISPTTVIVEGGGGSGLPEGWFDVKDYGALGNDTGDDGPSFNACIAAANVKGGVIYVPPGTYRITTALTVNPGKAISWVGDGSAQNTGSNFPVVSELHFPRS